MRTAPVCDFCSGQLPETELMFCSSRAGVGSAICDTCVDGFSAVIRVHRDSPALADGLIEAHNTAVRQSAGRH